MGQKVKKKMQPFLSCPLLHEYTTDSKMCTNVPEF